MRQSRDRHVPRFSTSGSRVSPPHVAHADERGERVRGGRHRHLPALHRRGPAGERAALADGAHARYATVLFTAALCCFLSLQLQSGPPPLFTHDQGCQVYSFCIVLVVLTFDTSCSGHEIPVDSFAFVQPLQELRIIADSVNFVFSQVGRRH